MIGLDDLDGDQQQSISELPKKPLKEWRRKFESGTLVSSNLMQFFQAASPFFFTIDLTAEYTDLARCSYDEQGAKNAIIDVLEEFIFGDNPETVLAKIRSEENASTVCGRVFKMNEPFYSCRECGMDPTCVLCVNCFKQSAHRYHKYKMGTSAGGGCCDCGDNEAWKQDHYCDEHKKGSEKILQSNLITERMRDRCMIVFDSILNYCVRSLKIDANGSIKNMETQDEDVYCTVLYNDETHTFDQVINTLTRIVGWQQKDAVEYVSTIDREGRAAVKCSTFQSCIKLKNDIENQALRSTIALKPTTLKVAVLHKNDVAYQQFSLQMLAWFQEFLTRHAVFRFLFCEILKQSTDYSLREILTNDSKLWKTARTSWHHLLISGMLMEYENKKTLAVMFTRQYTRVMQDFICHDDHDHSFSIVSMSVQLFTVPSIAQHLIANEDAFYKLMYTFYSESIEKYVKKKVLQFTRNAGNMNIVKRSAYILYDIKYILSFKPSVWSDELRQNFLHGVQMLIRLLREMQGMDSVFRQTGQHMEYEAEWEAAFNLHIKLAPVISLVLDWCSSDRIVLIKVYRMVMSALTETDFIVSQTTTEIKELADHSVWCLMYDVGSKPVSIHLPLSRFFAGLYLHLEKFNLTFDTVQVKKIKQDQTIEPRPDQIIEPVLCTLTMVAQVHAGMWRRNGYSLLNQLYFYRNVKCRAEMLDRDIVALQIGASLIESDDFLIHIINKFNLINWASPDYEATSLQNPEEDSIRQVINMIDELLELIIVVVGERHVPGVGMVTEEDKIKKEIIQYLCIKPYSHSELSRTLPDCGNEDGMESIIDGVAEFKKSKQFDKMGVYELRPQFFDDYNMYFYHYTKEEKSKSEEEQRKRRRDKKELVCCPPPKLPQLTPLFSMLANLLQCDVMLLIMHTVLKRAIDLKARSFSESHLQKVLHLIGYAVQEQESGAYPFFTFHERATKWDILPLMEELINSPRVEAHRDLILWTVRRYKTLQQSENQPMESDENATCSGVQAGTSSKSAAEIEKAEKEDRARLAAERRAKIMAQMACAQKNFMSSNAYLFESTTTSAQDKSENSMEWQDNNENNTNQICLGPDRKHNYVEDLVVTCILCSEDEVVKKTTGPCMVYSSFVQKSHVLLPLDTISYPHTSSCGHVMHASCWKEYFNNEVLKENRRPIRNRQTGMTTDKKEFLCPLCRCLSNAVIPISPALSRIVPSPQQPSVDGSSQVSDDIEPMPFDKWLYFMQNYNGALQLIVDLPIGDDVVTKLPDLESIVREFTSIEAFVKLAPPTTRELLPPELLEYVNEFASSAKRAAPYSHADEVAESHLVTWISCSYTIQTLEMYLRGLNKPLKGQMSIRQTSCLSGLIRESGLLVTTITDNIAAKLLVLLRSQLSTLFTNSSSCFIEWDLFRMLITFIFITPSVLYARTRQCIVPNGTLLEHYLLKTIFLALITKILVLHNIDESAKSEESTLTGSLYMDVEENTTFSNQIESSEDTQSPSDGECSSNSETDVLIEFYNNHNFYVIDARDAGVAPPAAHKTQKQLKKLVMKAIRNESRIFLRCACLLFHHLTDVDLPDELYDSDGDRFEVMCEYLGLSSDIETYLKCDSINSFMSNLAMHPDIEMFRTKQRAELKTVLVPCVPAVRKLVDLPVDYSDLINTVLTFSCPNNDRDESSRNPTMCLACGVTLCSMTYCCQYEIDGAMVGACTYHAHECGAGVGIFLRIRECDILLLGVNKGSFVSPPYLDKYGETDQGLRRGNPLKLCPERYQKLNLMWLNHGLHEDIARSAESINNVIPTQWQHL